MTIVSQHVRVTEFVLTVRPTYPSKAREGRRRSRSKHYSGKGSPNQEGEFLEIKHSRDRGVQMAGGLERLCAGSSLWAPTRLREVAFMLPLQCA